MKQLLKKLLFLAVIAAIASGCSPDENTTPNAVEDPQNTAAARTVGSVYPEFNSLFFSLYGTNYDVSNTTTSVNYNGETFRYNTVTSARTIKGYFIETRGNVLYYEHNATTRTITEYDWTGSSYTDTKYFIGSDQYYNANGFDPVPHSPLANSRFWGHGPSSPSDQLYAGPNGTCYRIMQHQYYVLWIAVDTINEIDPNTGGSLQVPAACDGSQIIE